MRRRTLFWVIWFPAVNYQNTHRKSLQNTHLLPSKKWIIQGWTPPPPFRGIPIFYTTKDGSGKPIFRCDTKTLALGRHIGQCPQHKSFVLGIPTCWYLKTLKFVLPPTQTPNANPQRKPQTQTPNANPQPKPPTQTPNANRWNIGRVGSPAQNSRIGHVDFMLFVLISFALVTQHEPSLQSKMGCRVSIPDGSLPRIPIQEILMKLLLTHDQND